MNEYTVTYYVADGRNAAEHKERVTASDAQEAAAYIWNREENEYGETIVDDILVDLPNGGRERFPY